MENNGEQFYRMMMEIKKAMEILENVCEKLTMEYFKAKPPKIHTVSSEEVDVFDNKKKKDQTKLKKHLTNLSEVL